MSLTYTQQAIDKRDARIKELEAEVAALKARNLGEAKTDPAPVAFRAISPGEHETFVPTPKKVEHEAVPEVHHRRR